MTVRYGNHLRAVTDDYRASQAWAALRPKDWRPGDPLPATPSEASSAPDPWRCASCDEDVSRSTDPEAHAAECGGDRL